MNETTKKAYKSLANNFYKTRLNGEPPSPKRVCDALKACAGEYRPAYWRKLRNALAFTQHDAGFSDAAEKINAVKNPITKKNSNLQVKKKQTRAKSVNAETHKKIITEIKKRKDKQLLAVVITAKITGARPNEIPGIEVLENGEVFIPGSKKRGDRGLDRTLRFSETETLYIEKAVAVIRKNGGKSVIGKVQDRLFRISKKLFPNRKAKPSLYSYRHQLGADLKSQGMPIIEISGVLGHQSVESCSAYGNPKNGSTKRSVKPTIGTCNGVRKKEKSHSISGITHSYSEIEINNVLSQVPLYTPRGPEPKF
jgi:hypothetical protein